MNDDDYVKKSRSSTWDSVYSDLKKLAKDKGKDKAPIELDRETSYLTRKGYKNLDEYLQSHPDKGVLKKCGEIISNAWSKLGWKTNKELIQSRFTHNLPGSKSSVQEVGGKILSPAIQKENLQKILNTAQIPINSDDNLPNDRQLAIYQAHLDALAKLPQPIHTKLQKIYDHNHIYLQSQLFNGVSTKNVIGLMPDLTKYAAMFFKGGFKSQQAATCIKAVLVIQGKVGRFENSNQTGFDAGVSAKRKLSQMNIVIYKSEDDQSFKIYKLGRLLGSGSYGSVRSHRNLDDSLNGKMAVKTVSRGDALPDLLNENKITHLLNPTNKAIGLQKQVNLVKSLDGHIAGMCHRYKGDYITHLEKLGSKKSSQKLMGDRIFEGAQLLGGLVQIHAQGVIHCDLKPENILTTSDGVVAISDFGGAQQIIRENPSSLPNFIAHTPCFTPRNEAAFVCYPNRSRPPISLNNSLEKIDVFQMGSILYSTFHPKSKMPYPEDSLGYADTTKPYSPIPSPPVPLEVKNLIDKMLDRSPSKRPSAEEAFEIMYKALSKYPEKLNELDNMGRISTKREQTILGLEDDATVLLERLKDPELHALNSVEAKKASSQLKAILSFLETDLDTENTLQKHRKNIDDLKAKMDERPPELEEEVDVAAQRARVINIDKKIRGQYTDEIKDLLQAVRISLHARTVKGQKNIRHLNQMLVKLGKDRPINYFNYDKIIKRIEDTISGEKEV